MTAADLLAQVDGAATLLLEAAILVERVEHALWNIEPGSGIARYCRRRSGRGRHAQRSKLQRLAAEL